MLAQFQQVRLRSHEVADLLAQYWPILVPVLLGGVAIYLILPRARPFPPLYGAVLAALALVAAGAWLVRSEAALPESILFYCFSGLAIVFGGLMIAQRNPVHSALSFAMVVLSSCGLFLLLAAPFLMAAMIIIYAGAIVVTFLFVIMLAQQEGLSNANQRSREPFLATVACFVLLASLLCVLQRSYGSLDLDHYLQRAERAAQASTGKEWQAILGQDDSFFEDFSKAVRPPVRQQERSGVLRDPGMIARERLDERLVVAQQTWNQLKPSSDGTARESPETVAAFRQQLADICKLGWAIQDEQGQIQPQAQPLSTFSGPAPGEAAKRDASGKLPERLPAANVAGLGRTLFTDYLLAVELAGTLLLVATIGAIAIAGRRPGGLR